MNGPGTTDAAERLPWVDGLKGAATFAVLLWSANSAIRGDSASGVFAWGSHGIEIFFVLSGLGLALPTIEQWRRQGSGVLDIAAYTLRRIARIVPAYWIALALIFTVGSIWPDVVGSPPTPRPEAADFVRQALFADRAANHPAPMLWTLAVFMRWYLIFPVLVALYVRSPRGFLTLTAVVATAYWLTRAHSTDLGCLPCLMLGIAAADAVVRKRLPGPPWWIWLVSGGAAAATLGPWTFLPDAMTNKDTLGLWPTNTGWQILAFTVVAGTGLWAPARRLAAWRPLRWIGTAAYSIYLVQEPFVKMTANAPATAPAGIRILLAASAGLAAGIAFYILVERPLRALRPWNTMVPTFRAKIAAALRTADWPQIMQLTGSTDETHAVQQETEGRARKIAIEKTRSEELRQPTTA